jgi:hypothetical protein
MSAEAHTRSIKLSKYWYIMFMENTVSRYWREIPHTRRAFYWSKFSSIKVFDMDASVAIALVIALSLNKKKHKRRKWSKDWLLQRVN